MDKAAAMLDMLERCDVQGVRRLWRKLEPTQPQPLDDAAALVALHAARTKCQGVTFKARAYSHAWLMDRGYPSLLPDELRPMAHRVYPVIASAVGFAMKGTSPQMREIIPAVQKDVSDAIEEAAADGRLLDSPFVRARIIETKNRAVRRYL